MGSHEPHNSSAARQLFIVFILIGAMVVLHSFAAPTNQGGDFQFDPTGMLALGFVILASFTIGQLVETIRLPHITGYLLAGILFGHSLTEFLPDALHLPAPFDHGVLHPSVIDQLGVFDSLAVALIALTAGGEMKLDALRKGFGAILGVLSGQLLAVFVGVIAFMWIVGGAFPAFTLPGIGILPDGSVIWVGLMIAAISFATSPAATIAVINGANAAGPMSRTILSAVVLKDVIVVIIFSVASVVALGYFSDDAAGPPGGLGLYLAQHILGSMLLGAGLGFAMGMYLRVYGKELLLFLVAVIYASTLLATPLHLDPVLIFLTAGFTVSNFSKQGDDLIHNVERLSMPVYVVFFTLAGARLHLDELMAVLPFALSLVGLRTFAIFIGSRWGASLGQADEMTRRHGWMGFVSQAGVALSLGAIIGSRFGEVGAALETLILAAVALNELAGPVLLKVSLSLAGEIGARQELEPEDEEPAPRLSGPAELEPIEEWPQELGEPAAWGVAASELMPEVRSLIRDIEAGVRDEALRTQRGPLTDFQQDSERFLRELRREYLRHCRRLGVAAKAENEADFHITLLRELGELADRWRAIVLARAARLERSSWTPSRLVDSIDQLVQSLPEEVLAPYAPETLAGSAKDHLALSIGRTTLRTKLALRRAFGQPAESRRVRMRDLARFHLSSKMPDELEGVAALLIQAESHLAARTRTIFDRIARHHRALISRNDEVETDCAAEVRNFRRNMDKSFVIALEEAERMGRDAKSRTAKVLAKPVRLIKEESRTFGSVDLPAWSRRPSRVFKQRVASLAALTVRLRELRTRGGGGYAVLGLELELAGFMARIYETVDDHVAELKHDARGRGYTQLQRVREALNTVNTELEAEISADQHGEELSIRLREIAEAGDRIISDAGRNASLLYEQMVEETTVAPMLDSLNRAARSLSDRYDITAADVSVGEWRLPPVGQVQTLLFRNRITEEIDTVIAGDLIDSIRSMAQKVQPLAAAIQETAQVLAFNLEIAQGELDLVHDETVPQATRDLLREMVIGTLERSEINLNAFADRAELWPTELETDLRDAVVGNIQALRERLARGDFSRVALDARKRELGRERLRQGLGRLPRELGVAFKQLGKGVFALLGAEHVEQLRRFLGLPEPRHDAHLGPDAFAAPAPIEGVPLIYLRLFSADSIEASDVITGRSEAISQAQQTLSGTPTGRMRSVALVGIDGVGKAAMASAIVRSGSFKNVRRITFAEPTSTAQVDELLGDLGEGRLIVLSGLHWLLAARPGGFEPLRRLVDGIISDGGNNAFLAHADSLWWSYASHIAPLEDAFPGVLHIDPLSIAALEDAVMKRHRLSDFDHLFEPQTSTSEVEGWLIRSAGRFKSAKDRYFRLLHTASGGLVRDALRLWTASILSVDEETRQVHVGPVPGSTYGDLLRLPEDVALTLYQIARQGWMSADVQAHLFRVDHTTAEAQLARLAHLGLLEHEGASYRIPVHLRGAVVRSMRERGWT